MTEHAASIFVFFFLAEYASILLMSILTSILFLGGYACPITPFIVLDSIIEIFLPIIWSLPVVFLETWDILYVLTVSLLFDLNFEFINFDCPLITKSLDGLNDQLENPVLAGYIYGFILGIKTGLIVFTFIWVRASFPRIRYDQLMSFCWTILLPVLFAFIIIIPCLLNSIDAIPVNFTLLSFIPLLAFDMLNRISYFIVWFCNWRAKIFSHFYVFYLSSYYNYPALKYIPYAIISIIFLMRIIFIFDFYLDDMIVMSGKVSDIHRLLDTPVNIPGGDTAGNTGGSPGENHSPDNGPSNNRPEASASSLDSGHGETDPRSSLESALHKSTIAFDKHGYSVSVRQAGLDKDECRSLASYIINKNPEALTVANRNPIILWEDAKNTDNFPAGLKISRSMLAGKFKTFTCGIG